MRPPVGTPGLTLDRYHIDSAYVAWRAGTNAAATFDLYARAHPVGSGYLLVAGLEQAVAFARAFRLTDDDLAYVRSMRPYDDAFLADLAPTRFTGEILAMPEGTVAFAGEPLLSVTAPFREALLLESGLLHVVSLATLIATKASRVVRAARGRPVAEFSLRRAQNPAVVARAAWIAGCASTSYLGAGAALGIPTSGTIPHALVQAFPTEADAFRAIASSLDGYVLLLDTYDVRRAIHTAVAVARDATDRHGNALGGVRLDSGDVAADARYCREVLDGAGLADARILASGDLDEYGIDELLSEGAPIDGFGVGTSIGVGAGSAAEGVDGGSLGSVYKLVWYEGGGDPAALKRAGEKSTWPGRKQAWRIGAYEEDLIALEDEPPPAHGEPLLEVVVKDGRTVTETPPLEAIRERARTALEALPERYRALREPPPYPVRHSERLRALRDEALRRRGLG